MKPYGAEDGSDKATKATASRRDPQKQKRRALKKKQRKPVELEGPPENGSIEDERCHQRWMVLASALGFNLLAKDHAKDLGSKAYFRLLRENAVKHLIELGGNGGVSPFAEDETILELEVPDVMPRLKFRAADIELMRIEVARHDVKKADLARAVPSRSEENHG